MIIKFNLFNNAKIPAQKGSLAKGSLAREESKMYKPNVVVRKYVASRARHDEHGRWDNEHQGAVFLTTLAMTVLQGPCR